jgi:hypothetical protein
MVSLDKRGQELAAKHEYYKSVLIAQDMNHADEPFRVEAYFDANIDGISGDSGIDPYEWTS